MTTKPNKYRVLLEEELETYLKLNKQNINRQGLKKSYYYFDKDSRKDKILNYYNKTEFIEQNYDKSRPEDVISFFTYLVDKNKDLAYRFLKLKQMKPNSFNYNGCIRTSIQLLSGHPEYFLDFITKNNFLKNNLTELEPIFLTYTQENNIQILKLAINELKDDDLTFNKIIFSFIKKYINKENQIIFNDFLSTFKNPSDDFLISQEIEYRNIFKYDLKKMNNYHIANEYEIEPHSLNTMLYSLNRELSRNKKHGINDVDFSISNNNLTITITSDKQINSKFHNEFIIECLKKFPKYDDYNNLFDYVHKFIQKQQMENLLSLNIPEFNKESKSNKI